VKTHSIKKYHILVKIQGFIKLLTDLKAFLRIFGEAAGFLAEFLMSGWEWIRLPRSIWGRLCVGAMRVDLR
jgi:hypothetical protein